MFISFIRARSISFWVYSQTNYNAELQNAQINETKHGENQVNTFALINKKKFHSAFSKLINITGQIKAFITDK